MLCPAFSLLCPFSDGVSQPACCGGLCTQALDRFKREENGILVATDVAARGLDVPGVRCVVCPLHPDGPSLVVEPNRSLCARLVHRSALPQGADL